MAYQQAAALEAHPPEVLLFLPLLRKSWRVFRNHARFLSFFSFATLAPVLTLLLVIQIFFAPDHKQSQNRPANSPPEKLSVTAVILVILYLVLSFSAALVQSAIFVHVVVGDHLGKPPGKLWLAVKRSFWRLAGTNVARAVYIMAISFATSTFLVIFVGILAILTNPKDITPFLIAAILIALLLYTIILIAFALHLSFADQVTVVEAPRVWGMTAVNRSWALCKGSRCSVLAVGALHVVCALLVTGPHFLLVAYFRGSGAGSFVATAGLAVVYAVSLVATSGMEAYFRVVWVVLYLSARKNLEPEFGLGTLGLYFDDDSKSPGDYLMVGISDAV